jgi:sec-independent protein translocase protein TatC
MTEIKTSQGNLDTPPEMAPEMPEVSQTLLQHLGELRTRLMWAMGALILASVAAYIYADHIFGFLVKPMADAMGDNSTQRMIYTSPAEAFFTYMKVAFFAGAFISFPVIAMQIWKFVAPGLYDKERGAFLPYLLATPILFFLGGATVYYVILPLALPFFLSFQTTPETTVLPIQMEARVSDYLDLVMSLIFAFGLCFQLPVILSLLVRAGMIGAAAMKKARRYVIVVVFFIAAILTPPDVISQTSLAVPMLALYEISILMAVRIEKARLRRQFDAALPDDPPPAP